MSTTTNIPWTNVTCNPAPGCKKVSPGCLHCYAERMARRLKAMGHKAYQDVVDEKGWTGKVGCQLDAMKVPGRGKMVFCQSMGDLFYEGVDDVDRDQVYGLMMNQPHHCFQVLTKQPENALRYFTQDDTRPMLPNVWLGVTCENQEWADKRIPVLLQIPAAVRFVSLEPLLGPVRLQTEAWTDFWPDNEHPLPKLDWCIIGCESGPGARRCDLAWIESLIKQCHEANVPVFVKQVRCKNKIIREANQISQLLARPVESIRQFPPQSP